MATATAKKTEAAMAPPAIVTQPEAATPATMLEKAITSGANVEVMEKLLALQERWEANQARKAFVQAISEVRADLPAIVKNKEVDFTTAKGRTHYQYEDLAGVVEALAPVLAAHGLSFRWRTRSDQTTVFVTCILSHAQGFSEETELACRHDDSGNKNPIQAIGSAVTYLQRYTLKAAIGIAASHDDDAMSASAETMPHFRQAGREPIPAAAQPPFISEPQRKRLYAIVMKKDIPTDAVKNYLGGFGFQTSGEITRDKYDEIVKWAEEWDALTEFAPDPTDDIPDFSPIPYGDKP